MLITLRQRLHLFLVCFLLIVALAQFVSHLLLQVETPSAERIGMLLKQLGSEDFAEREAATKALGKLKASARAALEKAVEANKDLELVRRATELVEKLDNALCGEIYCLKGHDGIVLCVAFSPDSNYALSGGKDKTLRLWDLQTGKVVRVFYGHGDNIYGVAFCQDGNRAISCSRDETLRLWDVRTGKELRSFKGHKNAVMTVTRSADGKWALSGGWDNTLRLWDLDTGKELRRFEGHTEAIGEVALSPDSKQVLSGSMDTTVVVWDVETGQELHTMEGHTNWVSSVAFSPDGKHALSGSMDGTFRLWNVEMGKELRCFKDHLRPVNSVCFSLDGKTILSGSVDYTVRYGMSLPVRNFTASLDIRVKSTAWLTAGTASACCPRATMGRYGYGRCLIPVNEASSAAFRNLVPVVAGIDGGLAAREDGG